MSRTVGYIRVSTNKQGGDGQESAILRFANERRFGSVDFVRETASGSLDWRKRDLAAVVEDLEAGDRLVVYELSRLGRSLLNILELLKETQGRGVEVYEVKGGFEIGTEGVQGKVMTVMLGLMAEIERDLISQRTKEALTAARAKGVRLGRPRGPGKSKLDQYAEEIPALLRQGASIQYLSARYGCSASTLSNWMKQNEVDWRALRSGGVGSDAEDLYAQR